MPVSMTCLGASMPWQPGAAPRPRQQWSVPMTTRRLACLALVSSALHGIAVPSARAQNAPPGSAAAFIKEMVARLTAVVNAPGNDDAVGQKLQTIVDSSVDVGRIAQFCLGRFWRSTTAPQQQEYLALFHRVLLNGVTGNVKGYKGVVVTVGRVQARDAESIVSTIIERPGQAAANVDWVVAPTPAGFRIEDVVAEGTSLRVTQRSDYTAFLQQHGGDVSVLLDAMRQHSAK